MLASETRVSARDSSSSASSTMESRGVRRECEASRGCFDGWVAWLDDSELLRFRCVAGLADVKEPPTPLAWFVTFEGGALSITLLGPPRDRGLGGSMTHSVVKPFDWHRLQIMAVGANRQRAFARLQGTQTPRLSSASEVAVKILKTSIEVLELTVSWSSSLRGRICWYFLSTLCRWHEQRLSAMKEHIFDYIRST